MAEVYWQSEYLGVVNMVILALLDQCYDRENSVSLFMVFMGFLTVMLRATVSKPLTVQCWVTYPLPSLHEYRQSGNIFVGVVASHTFIVSSPVDFRRNAPPPLSDELL